MTNTENKKDTNWTMIGCAGLATLLIGFYVVTMKVSKITEQYRYEYIAQFMNQNDALINKECNLPIAAYISQIKRNGVTTDGRNEIDMVDAPTRDRCVKAQFVVANNKEKMKKAKYVKAPFSYITENLLK